MERTEAAKQTGLLTVEQRLGDSLPLGEGGFQLQQDELLSQKCIFKSLQMTCFSLN
jgi:hypothetical protein